MKDMIESIEKIAKSLEPNKRMYANQKTIDTIKEKLGYHPDNLIFHPHIPDNQAIYFDNLTLADINKFNPFE